MPTTTPPPVTLVLGDEELLAERAVADIVAAATAALGPGTEVARFQADALPDGFALDLATTSLFGGGRVLVVDNAQDLDANARKAVLAAAGDPAPGTSLVLRAAGVGRQAKFFSAVGEHAQVVRTPKLKPAERVRWVKAEIRSLGRKSDERAVALLVELVGADLRGLAGAVAKLHVAIPPPAAISADHVAEHLTPAAQRGVFEFTDAVLAGDAAKALSVMDALLAQGESEIGLMGMLAGQLRRLIQVTAEPDLPDARVAERAGIREWQVKNARRQARRYRPDQLTSALAAVAQADAELRTGALGTSSQRILLQLLVTRVAGT